MACSPRYPLGRQHEDLDVCGPQASQDRRGMPDLFSPKQREMAKPEGATLLGIAASQASSH